MLLMLSLFRRMEFEIIYPIYLQKCDEFCFCFFVIHS